MLNPPLDYLQSTHGRDDASQMWPPLPIRPQNMLFLTPEYFDLEPEICLMPVPHLNVHCAREYLECLSLELIQLRYW